MPDRTIRLLGALFALITSWLWAPQPAVAGGSMLTPAAMMYAYVAPIYDTPSNDTGQERGPPGVVVANTTYDAADVWLRGPSARPGGLRAQPTIIYASIATVVRGARATTTTGGHAALPVEISCRFQRARLPQTADGCSGPGATWPRALRLTLPGRVEGRPSR